MRSLDVLAVLALSVAADRGPAPSTHLLIFRGDGYTFAYPESATVTHRARGVELTGPQVETPLLLEPLYRLSVDVVPADSLPSDTASRVVFVRGTRAVVFHYTIGLDENVFPTLQRVLYNQIVSSFRWNTPSDAAIPRRGLLIYRGDGFTLAYPTIARVARSHSRFTDLNGTAFVGPEITTRVALENHGTSEYTTTSFDLFVSVQPNPGRLSLQQWADSLVAKHNRDLEQDDDDRLPPPDTMTVAGQPALVLRPSCGDCDNAQIYLARGPRVVVFDYDYGDNSSLPEMQHLIYAQMLASFRWIDSER